MNFPLTFDELNQMVGYNRSMPFEEYFGDMKISDKQKEQRIELAEQLEDEFAYMVALMFYERGSLTADMATELRDRYLDALVAQGLVNQQMVDRANEIINGAMGVPDYSFDESAIRRANEFAVGATLVTMNHSDDPYYFSLDRARLMAENESNTIWNSEEFIEAEAMGYAFKTWETAGDNHVRYSHAEIEGLTIPIDEPFELYSGLAMYPRDSSLGLDDSDIVNCRCSIEYSGTTDDIKN